MPRHQPDDPRRTPQERARDERGPGAHSGRESRPRERSVPGTAGAREGYPARGGTAHDEPLEGVRARGGRTKKDAEKERTRDEGHGKNTQP
ncbi:hypothetical protein SNS2_4508 [Streptomyces netropsis]|uniref:Uncharacterized protein n=1 Tax=Streptomyces syringium TaxID=76729 RepID=A0ABS4YEB5_9ACTN|nr:hypothetical protein [Streptomyces syringium]MBP2407074.1 hypothetical protein [Streptomyces syringium]SPE62186.1 hypothetical protein SNS2_4508 [Streptomyces netropsis]